MDAHSHAQSELDEFQEDIAFQRRFWRVERIAWAMFALVLALALAGLTGGGGPLSHARATTPYGWIEYPRVTRWQREDQVKIHFDHAVSPVSIELGQGFVDAFDVISAQPQPSWATATARGVRYRFDIEDDGAVVLQIKARQPALSTDAAVRVGSTETRVRPLILP